MSLVVKKSGLRLPRSEIPGWLTEAAGEMRACVLHLGNKHAVPLPKKRWELSGTMAGLSS